MALNPGKSDPGPLRDYLIATCFGIALVVWYQWSFGQYASPWMGDAGRYVEATRSFLRGEPFLLREPDGATPIRLWPPGYPFLGGVFALVGVDPATAILLVAQLAVAVLSPACFWALGHRFNQTVRICTVIVCVTAPGVLTNANLVSSDAVFLVFAVLVIGLVIRGRFGLGAGLACLSLMVRNSAVALILTVGVTAILDDPRPRVVAKRIAACVFGGLAPLVLVAGWNLYAFATLTPYQMPQSTTGLWKNTADMGRAIIYDLVPIWSLAEAVPGLLVTALTLAMACTVAATGILRANPDSGTRRAALCVGAYIIFGVVMTIAARTRYQWGEGIWERHSAQYDWLLIPAVAMFALVFVRMRPSMIRAMIIAITLLIVVTRGWNVVTRLTQMGAEAPVVETIVETGDATISTTAPLRQMFRAFGAVEGLGNVLREAAPTCLIVSNLADLFVGVFDVRAFGLDGFQSQPVQGPVLFVIAVLGPAAGGTPPAPEGTKRLLIAGIPAGLRFYSNRADVCLPSALNR